MGKLNYLKDWYRNEGEDIVHLIYESGNELLVKYADFNRAFQVMVSSTYETIREEFAI